MTSGTKSDFLDALLSGRRNTEDEWLTYFERFHADQPTANEFFTLLATLEGQTSYRVLARAAAAIPARNILDIGCGDGNLTEELLDACAADVRFTGVDICAPEIALAQERFFADSRVAFVSGDARALPFNDASFDLVVSHQFFNFLPSPVVVLREAARVLAPGGTLLFAVNRGWRSEPSDNWVHLYKAAAEAIKELYPHFAEHPLIDDPRIYFADGIRDILTEAGLFDMGSLTIEHASPRALLTPEAAAAIYNRMYFFASVPRKEAVQQSVIRRATELAQDGLIEIEVPFRFVRIERARR
jgi:ubiquinone/menaquinone biosynthesis C-methylase UbiE